MGSLIPGMDSLQGQRGAAFPMDQLPRIEFSSFMHTLDAVMFDCDGVLWMGMEPLPGAQRLIAALRSLDKKIFFLTNNSTKTREEFLDKFEKLGFKDVTLDEVVGTSYLAALYLKEKEFKGKVYVIGSTGVTRELEQVGIESLPIGPDAMPPDMFSWTSSSLNPPKMDPGVGAVVVGFDHHLSYLKMIKAASYLNNPDCLFIATNTDERFPSRADLVLPGTGSIVNAVKTAAEREPVVMGKPHTFPFEYIKRTHDLDPNRVLMIGDRANTDILFGKNCGLWTLLVLSGVTNMEEVEKWKNSDSQSDKDLVPDFYLKGVADLVSLIEASAKQVFLMDTVTKKGKRTSH